MDKKIFDVSGQSQKFDLVKIINEQLEVAISNLKGSLMVTEEEQQTAIEERKTITKLMPCATFVVNILNGQVEHVQGIDNLLGYNNGTFTMKDYFNSMPQEVFPILASESYAVMLNCLEGKYKEFGFMKGYFTVCHSLKKRNGEQIYVMRTSTPFQFTSSMQITAYYNTILLIGKYVGQPYTNGVIDLPEKYLENLKSDSAKLRLNRLKLSPSELVIINYHLANGYSESNIEVSQNLKLKLETYNKCRQRIRIKASEYSQAPMNTKLSFEASVHLLEKLGVQFM
jgi:hypothetical protein